VRVLRSQGLLLAASAVAGLLTAVAGCSSSAVGEPCLPEQIPEGGFAPSEAYIESNSVQCETRVCLVWKLRGAPAGSAVCAADPSICASQEQVNHQIYCTCRCDAADLPFKECECPRDYSCVPVIEQGSEGVRGSYCVKSSTVSL